MLATGFATVIAALILGIRQIKVITRQVDIQDQQARSAQASKILELRVAVFEHRLKCIESFRLAYQDYLESQYATAIPTLLKTLVASRLLFSKEIHESLDQAFEKLYHLGVHHSAAVRAEGAQDRSKADEQYAKADEFENGLGEQLKSLIRRMEEETNVFGSETLFV